MKLTTINMVKSKLDNVVKYIIEDSLFGKNEVSVIYKETKTIICLPSQTNCNIGCKFCHLTGTKRPVKCLSVDWFVSVVDYIVQQEQITNSILISFMGAGEPLLNIQNITNACESIHMKHNSRFAVATTLPTIHSIRYLSQWAIKHNNISFKLHLSVHGMKNRSTIVKSNVSIDLAIHETMMYSKNTNNPIEFHYTLVNGVNDQLSELMTFHNAIHGCKCTVKFLTLSENNNCFSSSLPNELLLSIFSNHIVEFYDPPGRDVGSSCGMFDIELYNE